jgi:hypothetical protein
LCGVLQLLTTDEFAAWFLILDDRAAEDVATMLEVIVQLGTRTEAPGSSEWLTWYEHPGMSARIRERGIHLLPPALRKFLDAYGAFNGYTRRVLKHLESPPFIERLARLEPREAAAVADAVARIRKTATARRLAVSQYQQRRPGLGVLTVKPEDEAAFGRFTDLTEIREAYLAALAAAGFAVVDLPAHSPALREITQRSPAPGFRLLYGVDTQRNQGLVALGEWMDRSFYGDSVRHAELLWRRFLNGDLTATQPARAR